MNSILFLFIIYSSIILGVKSIDGDVFTENHDGSLAKTILTKEDGRTESSNSGGQVFVIRSPRPRASAVPTFIGGDRTPRLRAVHNDSKGIDFDLHTAYRLPLQRLSDRQLSLLLAKYSPNDTSNSQKIRADMINAIQEKIVEKSEKKLIRPVLLTNINMLPTDVAINAEPAVDAKAHQRTTVAPVGSATELPIVIRKPEYRRSQKLIPEIESETNERLEKSRLHVPSRMKELSQTLRQVKAKYDAAKIHYMRRLRELNERKITLAVPTKSAPHQIDTTNLSTFTTNENLFVVDNENQQTERQEIPTTQETSPFDGFRKILAYVKAKNQQNKLHDGDNDDSEKQQKPRSGPPRASPIPVVHGAEIKKVKQPVDIAQKTTLLLAGGEGETTSVFENQRSFSFNMKKVSDITAHDLIDQLNDELKATTIATTTTEEIFTTTQPEETTIGDKIVVSNDDETDLADFAAASDENVCDAISCDFEKGDLCQWEASNDEISPDSPHYRRKHRKAHYVRRTWHNWQGRYRNRVTGIARAQVFSFENQRFAAAYVRPFQRATLTGKLLSGEQETIRFRAWEATRNVQLKVCCDTTENCVFETEIGVFRGSRRWREHTATCPKGTSKIIFECINHGIYQGACGVDNIHLANLYCPQVIPLTPLIDNEQS
uniref:Uncharacterized protein n=1 Tax=Panagrolaimus sp. JU765 TaxID=591449 RepID=A0AC34Q2I8_9BILA